MEAQAGPGRSAVSGHDIENGTRRINGRCLPQQNTHSSGAARRPTSIRSGLQATSSLSQYEAEVGSSSGNLHAHRQRLSELG